MLGGWWIGWAQYGRGEARHGIFSPLWKIEVTQGDAPMARYSCRAARTDTYGDGADMSTSGLGSSVTS